MARPTKLNKKISGKRGPKKGQGGRPPKLRIDAKLTGQVEAMAGLGLTIEQIGLILDVSEATVHRYKSENTKLMRAYQKGRAQGGMEATNSLRGLIRAGNVTAIIFYLKTQCRWKEVSQHEHTGPDGGPIQVIQIGDQKIEF